MKIRKIAMGAVFCALIAVLSQVSIPLPGMVPLTLQTFAVALCGSCLGRSGSVISVAVYLLLGAVGVPVFSSFHGGVSWLFGPTGGFLWGFLLLAFCCAWPSEKRWLSALLGFLGMLLCHALGLGQYMIVTGNHFIHSFMLVSMPFLLKDYISILLAKWLKTRIPGRFFE